MCSSCFVLSSSLHRTLPYHTCPFPVSSCRCLLQYLLSLLCSRGIHWLCYQYHTHVDRYMISIVYLRTHVLRFLSSPSYLVLSMLCVTVCCFASFHRHVGLLLVILCGITETLAICYTYISRNPRLLFIYEIWYCSFYCWQTFCEALTCV